MIPLTAGDLALMQQTQQAAMHDACQVLVFQQLGTDPLGSGKGAWVVRGDPVPCGFTPAGMGESADGAQAVLTSPVARLPITTDLTQVQRLRVTHRYGVAVDPVDYEIVGLPKRGPSGLVCELQQVTVTAAGPVG